ncbi:MAG: hypothetical protein K1X64_18070 [Myxococcaceae bacterium]|nr:hypothetical protein [Myxococcaceae bacterium]
MPSHPVHRLIRWNDSGPDTVHVEAELSCGCLLSQDVLKERLVPTTDGGYLLVGKFPCPLEHAVQRREGSSR